MYEAIVQFYKALKLEYLIWSNIAACSFYLRLLSICQKNLGISLFSHTSTYAAFRVSNTVEEFAGPVIAYFAMLNK